MVSLTEVLCNNVNLYDESKNMSFYKIEKNTLFIVDEDLDINIVEPFLLPKLATMEIENKREKKVSGITREAFGEKNNKRFGETNIFYPDGSLQSICYYLEDLLHGPSIFYSADGTLLSESWFHNGKRVGVTTLFYPSGAVYSIQKFVNDEFHKNQKYFHEDGSVKSYLEYENGLLHGKFLLFWPNGNKKREAFFESGKREGTDRIWNQNGTLIDEGEYVNNLPVKAHKRYNAEGGIIEEIFYHTSKEFDVRKFDGNGNIIYSSLS